MEHGEEFLIATADKPVFLCVGNDWGRHWSSILHLFRVIARDHRVIWVNSIGQRAPRLSKRDFLRLLEKARRPRLQVLSEETATDGRPVAVIEPRVLPYHRFGFVRGINTRILGRQLAPVLERWVSRGQQLVFVTSNPAAVDLVGRFGATLSFYYCMDDYGQMRDMDASINEVCEPPMLEAVDCTFATSRALCESKRARHYETVHLPQGVDFDHFRPGLACPPPMAHISHPIIGFQGIVGERVDLALLEKIACAFPSASLVTIGRREADISSLRRYDNFFHFDHVPYAQLPAWVAQFDVGLVAYVTDGHTASVNPLKLLEYLALGQQVVSTSLPELQGCREYVHMAEDHHGYLQALADMLSRYPFDEAEKTRRREFARGQSWEARAKKFLAVCNQLSAQKKPGADGASRIDRDAPAAGAALMYHDVVVHGGDESGLPGADARVYKLNGGDFERHLAALARAFPGGPLVRRPGEAHLSYMPFMLTFDDGGSSMMAIADRLERRGWRAHFFLITGRLGQPGFLSTADARELHGRGHVVGSHSVSHPLMISALPTGEIEREWKESVMALEDTLGVPVDTASVPGGYLSRAVVQGAARAGVRCLWTSEPTRRLRMLGGMQIIGRYMIQHGTSPAQAVALAQPGSSAQFRSWLAWNTRKPIKGLLGPLYPYLRGQILSLKESET
jgi:peptidoglycan/xylan/chitin deacetylase (PgdA/CDA1 family)